MFTYKLMGLWLLCVYVVFCKEDTKVDDENRPYEFGFSIDGQQHRHERRDANGIIQGEFGFITADGIYHVTVYATDENGRFKILSMRNIRISGPLDGSQAGSYTTKPLPIGQTFSTSTAANVNKQVITSTTPIPKPTQVQNVQNVQIANVGAVTKRPDVIGPNIQSSKQPFVFTTQATIKPACAGCGYVTKSSSTTPKSEIIPNGGISVIGQSGIGQNQITNVQSNVPTQGQPVSTSQGGNYAPGGFSQGQNQQSINQMHQSTSSLGSQPFNAQKPLGQNIPQSVNYPSGQISQTQGGSVPAIQGLTNQNMPQNSPSGGIIQGQSQTSQIEGGLGVQPSIQGPTNQNTPQSYPSSGINQGQSQTSQIEGGLGVQPSIQGPTNQNVPQNVNYNSGGITQGQGQTSQSQGGPGLQPFNTQRPTNQNVPQNVNYPTGGITQGQGQLSQAQGGSGSQPSNIPGPTNQNIPQNYPSGGINQISPPQSGVGNSTNIQGPGIQNVPQNTNDPSGVLNQGQNQIYQTPSGLGLQPSNVQNQQGTGITTESGSVQITPSRNPPTEVLSHGITNQNAQNPHISTSLQTDQGQSKPHSIVDDIKIENNAILVPNNPPIPIEDKYPGMTDGLPDGITTGDISDLLYKFNYTIGFHGHYEMGWRNGTKVGGYFVNGRDGISRIVTYVADEFGYRPKVRLINLGYESILTPKEETEKSFGLQTFEFVWYPLK